MKRSVGLAAAIALLSLPQPALADGSCIGTVTRSYVIHDGAVVIYGSWRNDFTQICNLKTTWKTITPEICASWKAMVDAAVSLGRQMDVYYQGVGSMSCAAIPYYGSAPAPNYVMLY